MFYSGLFIFNLKYIYIYTEKERAIYYIIKVKSATNNWSKYHFAYLV